LECTIDMRDYCIIEPQADNQNNNKYKALDMGIPAEDIKFSLIFVFIAIIDLILYVQPKQF
jgi:hypothetical protein